ncbi:glycosyltransferase [Tunturiibacter empetritectus]|uniref:glycosyltransferase n=1 Tax=Tunturiibacter empetritectus TaxID=3069691 RepID=UPI003D9AF2BE
MKFLFWICLALTAYAYFGYAVLLSIWVYFRRQSIRKTDYTPDVSILIAARNEEANLPSKLENLRMLNYPKARLEIVVASDGSTDRTAEILLEQPPLLSQFCLKSPAARLVL